MQLNVTGKIISVEEAIKVIEMDDRKNPVVDTVALVNGLPFLRVNGNYTIKLLGVNSEGKIVSKGSTFSSLHQIFPHFFILHSATSYPPSDTTPVPRSSSPCTPPP